MLNDQATYLLFYLSIRFSEKHCKETNDLNKDAEYLVEEQEQQETQDQENSKINQCQLFVTHLSMRRNKRCLLAYEKSRADKITEFLLAKY